MDRLSIDAAPVPLSLPLFKLMNLAKMTALLSNDLVLIFITVQSEQTAEILRQL